MSKSFLSSMLILILLPGRALAAVPDIVISEVQVSGAKADDEFVRLRNDGIEPVDLSGFKLTKKYASKGACKESALVSEKHFRGTIAPESTFLISHPDYKDFYRADLDYSSASYYLTNNAVVTLYDADGNPISEKTVGNACDADQPDPLLDEPDPSIAPSMDGTIRLNELFPNPKEKGEANEWIELYNFGESAVDIGTGWKLEDKSKSYDFGEEPVTIIPPGGYLVIPRERSGIALNNSDETVSLVGGSATDTVSYGSTKEEQSFNYSPSGWRWSKKTTPGAANTLNNLPEREKTEIPKTAYRNVFVDFFAKGSDADGDTLKYVWNFGDGRKSYRKETRHKYAETGTYYGTLSISDGAESTVKEFELTVKKYPDRKIRITALSANPAGADTGVEWLLIKNKDKKKVDLLGWSVATGTKKKTVANHPIRESFILKPGEEKRITSPIALFTLPNERGVIELRRPDGKTAQTVRYRKDGGIDTDELYSKKVGGGWEWTRSSQQTTNNNQQSADKKSAIVIPTTSEAIEAEEAAIGGMSVIEERTREAILATIIAKETAIETPIKFLVAPPRVLGATVERTGSGKLRSGSLLEDLFFALSGLISTDIDRRF